MDKAVVLGAPGTVALTTSFTEPPPGELSRKSDPHTEPQIMGLCAFIIFLALGFLLTYFF